MKMLSAGLLNLLALALKLKASKIFHKQISWIFQTTSFCKTTYKMFNRSRVYEMCQTLICGFFCQCTCFLPPHVLLYVPTAKDKQSVPHVNRTEHGEHLHGQVTLRQKNEYTVQSLYSTRFKSSNFFNPESIILNLFFVYHSKIKPIIFCLENANKVIIR